MSAVIPWTNPGGTPCCCGTCSNEEIPTNAGTRHWSANVAPQIVPIYHAASTENQNFPFTFSLELNREFIFNGNTINWVASRFFTFIDPFEFTGQNAFSKFANDCRGRVAPIPISAARIMGYTNGDVDSPFYTFRDAFVSFANGRFYVQDGGAGWPGSTEPPPTLSQPRMFGGVGSIFEVIDDFFGAFFNFSVFFDNDEVRGAGDANMEGSITIFGESVKWGHNWNNTSNEFSVRFSLEIGLPPP